MDFSKEIVLVHGPGAAPYMTMFKKAGFGSTDDIDKATIICFTGGEDVNPALYGEEMLRINERPMSGFCAKRDDRDALVHGLGLAAQVLQIGICRGGQFLNVMNDGKMWQHVNGHTGGPHEAMDTKTGEVIKVSSTHHQMMRPGPQADVWAVAREAGYRRGAEDTWVRGKASEDDAQVWDKSLDDVEVVWYEGSKCLCFQPHPEFSNVPECTKYFFEVVERALAAA